MIAFFFIHPVYLTRGKVLFLKTFVVCSSEDLKCIDIVPQFVRAFDDLLNGLCQCENINIQDGVDGKLITLVTILRDFS